jgi:alkylation response protein AidB-like acyl-CoA dehydrogenase
MLDNLTDEQRMLRDTVTTILRDAETAGTDPWAGLAEIGLGALPFSEEDGGFGSGTTELALVVSELGRIRSSTPFIASVVVGSALLRDRAGPEQKRELLPDLVVGSKTVTLAHYEPASLGGSGDVQTSATLKDGFYHLSGLKCLVEYGAKADMFIVSATVAGQSGVSLFVVDRESAGVQIAPYHRPDGTFDADVRLTDVVVPASRKLSEGNDEAVEAALRLGMALSCVEAHGAMVELQQQTLDYMRTRRQFGTPIASYQALQHRAVDMFVEVEQARSMAEYALGCLDLEGDEARLGPVAAKLFVAKAARIVGESAVQLHGAIGMTLESNAGRLFQRLTAFQAKAPDANAGLATLLEAPGSVLEGFADEA